MTELKEATDESITILLVGNKADLGERKITSEEAMEFATKNKISYIETSAKLGVNINEAFNEITKQIYAKVADGKLDIMKESSGVRVGTETSISEYSQGKSQKLANEQKWSSCINC